MSFIKRPNKNALAEAIDIYLDEMRPFLIDCLTQIPGADAKECIETSLRNDLADNFARNLGQSSELLSALEPSFFRHIVEYHWEEVFSAKFRKKERIPETLGKVAIARNKVAHPAHLLDLDQDFTLEHINVIVDLLGELGAWDSKDAVSIIRSNLVNQEEEARMKEERIRNLNDQFGKAVANLRQCEAKHNESKSKLQKEASAREKAEERARTEAVARQEAEQLAQIAESSLKKAEGIAKDTGAAERKAKRQLEIEATARKNAESDVQELDTACRMAKQKAQEEAKARADAEQQALAEVAAWKKAEQRAREAESSLVEATEKVQAKEIVLQKAENRIEALEQERDVSRPAFTHTQAQRPVDRSTPSYELWLIDEIQSGKIGRTLLSEYADDGRIDGRLLHYVRAAASDMTPSAWQNYVATRQQALERQNRRQYSGSLGFHH